MRQCIRPVCCRCRCRAVVDAGWNAIRHDRKSHTRSTKAFHGDSDDHGPGRFMSPIARTHERCPRHHRRPARTGGGRRRQWYQGGPRRLGSRGPAMPRRRRGSGRFLCAVAGAAAAAAIVLQWGALHAGAAPVAPVDAPRGPPGDGGDGEPDWRDMDYYQILGLDPARDLSIGDADLRRAYRAQAKRHHPDKVAGGGTDAGRAASGTAAAPSERSPEDINGRFVRIAEAYQVLSDPRKRQEYDQYLAQQRTRQQQQQYQRREEQRQDHHGHAHGGHRNGVPHGASDPYFSSEPIDPFAVFEKVFADFMSQFSTAGRTGAFQDPWHDAYDATAAWESAGSGGSGSRGGPVRTRRERTEYVDAFGQTVLRLRETEEHPEGAYRVLVQDFVEEWDPFQRRWVLLPLQPRPVVVQEGRLWHSAAQRVGQDSAQREWLLPGDVLTVGMRLENPPFEAVLTPSCELTVRYKRGDETDIRWSSGVAMARRGRGYCGLWLQGRHLVIATLQSPQLIIWLSNRGQTSPEEDFENPLFVHAARLDDDGCLSVYRLEEPDPFWVNAIQATTEFSLLQKLVAKIGGIALAFEGPVRTVCVFSTGPMGCFRLGRFLRHYMRKASEWFNRLASRFFV